MNSGRARLAERAFLALLLLLSLGLRLYGIGHLSFAEDEAAKWNAIQKYRHGQFAGVNSEHPMLMKVLAWASLAAGERYNRWAQSHGLGPVTKETWLRLPVVLFGAATSIVLYLLARQMLGWLGAGLAAFFWAVSPLSVSLNRVLKEEALFAFFTLLAFYFYNRAKLAPTEREAKRNFLLAGAAFGLDMASYYLAVGQFGLIVLIWHIANKKRIPSRQMGPYFWRSVLVGALAFLLCNPVILSPRNLLAMTRYSEEKTIQHRGYLIDGHVLLNNALTTPYGLPWYYYLWVLAVKTPLPILAAAAAGILLLLRERASLLSIFLRVTLVFWFVPYTVAGSKWIRYVIIVLPSFYLAAGWAAEKLRDWLRGRLRTRAWQLAMAGIILALTVWPAANAFAWAPYNRLFVNALGGGTRRAGRLFPPDEVYDLGVRQSMRYVCQVAPRGAIVAGSDPMGLGFYAKDFGRPDLRVTPLFDPNYVLHPGDYVMVQDSRRYFETTGLITLIEKVDRPAREARIDGLVTVAVYRWSNLDARARSAALSPQPSQPSKPSKSPSPSVTSRREVSISPRQVSIFAPRRLPPRSQSELVPSPPCAWYHRSWQRVSARP